MTTQLSTLSLQLTTLLVLLTALILISLEKRQQQQKEFTVKAVSSVVSVNANVKAAALVVVEIFFRETSADAADTAAFIQGERYAWQLQ